MSPPAPPRTAVAIDGLDGSGKSRFAAALAAALRAAGRPASVLAVDDFRRQLELDGLEPAAEATLYYDRYFDFTTATGELARRVRGPADGTITVVEGVMVLRAGLPAGTPLIVLEVSAEEARRRIQLRDQAKGRTAEEITRRIDRRYFPAHARYRATFDPLGRADLVIDNGDWARPRVTRRGAVALPAAVSTALSTDLGVALDRVLGAG